MIGNEVSRISPVNTNSITPTTGNNQSSGNLIPAILIIGGIRVVGAIILNHTQQKIDERKRQFARHHF